MLSGPQIKILVVNLDNPRDLFGVNQDGKIAPTLIEKNVPFVKLKAKDKITLFVKKAQQFSDMLAEEYPEAKGIVVCRENGICDGEVQYDPTLSLKDLTLLRSTLVAFSKKHPNVLCIPGTIAVKTLSTPDKLKTILASYQSPLYEWALGKEVMYFRGNSQVFRLNKQKIEKSLRENQTVPIISNVLYAFFSGHEFQHGKLINALDDYCVIPNAVHELPTTYSSPLLQWEDILIGLDLCLLSAFSYIEYAVSKSKYPEKIPLIQLVIANGLSDFSLSVESIISHAIHIDRHAPISVIKNKENVKVYSVNIGEDFTKFVAISSIHPLQFQLFDGITSCKNALVSQKDITPLQKKEECAFQKVRDALFEEMPYVFHTRKQRKNLISLIRKQPLPVFAKEKLITLITESKYDQSHYHALEGFQAITTSSTKKTKRMLQTFKPLSQKKVTVLSLSEQKKTPKVGHIIKKPKLEAMITPSIDPLFDPLFTFIQEARLSPTQTFLWLGDYFGIYIKDIYKEKNRRKNEEARREMKLMAGYCYLLAQRFDPYGKEAQKMFDRLKEGCNIDFSTCYLQLEAFIPAALDFPAQFQYALAKAKKLIIETQNLTLKQVSSHVSLKFKKLYAEKKQKRMLRLFQPSLSADEKPIHFCPSDNKPQAAATFKSCLRK